MRRSGIILALLNTRFILAEKTLTCAERIINSKYNGVWLEFRKRRQRLLQTDLSAEEERLHEAEEDQTSPEHSRPWSHGETDY